MLGRACSVRFLLLTAYFESSRDDVKIIDRFQSLLWSEPYGPFQLSFIKVTTVLPFTFNNKNNSNSIINMHWSQFKITISKHNDKGKGEGLLHNVQTVGYLNIYTHTHTHTHTHTQWQSQTHTHTPPTPLPPTCGLGNSIQSIFRADEYVKQKSF